MGRDENGKRMGREREDKRILPIFGGDPGITWRVDTKPIYIYTIHIYIYIMSIYNANIFRMLWENSGIRYSFANTMIVGCLYVSLKSEIGVCPSNGTCDKGNYYKPLDLGDLGIPFLRDKPLYP